MIRKLQIGLICLLLVGIALYFGFKIHNYDEVSAQNLIREDYMSIEIRGNNAFIDQTRTALHLLKNNAPEAFLRVNRYIGIIEEGKHSAMWAYKNPPRFEVNRKTAFYSLTWYAGVLAHEATHSQLFHDYKSSNTSTKDVPNHVWKEREAEILCIKYQLEVMKMLRSPQHEIDHISAHSNDGTHSDIDKDGDVDWLDYLRRDW